MISFVQYWVINGFALLGQSHEGRPIALFRFAAHWCSKMKNESLTHLHNIKYIISNSCFKQSDKRMNYLIQH
jgi:hypothetical protein